MTRIVFSSERGATVSRAVLPLLAAGLIIMLLAIFWAFPTQRPQASPAEQSAPVDQVLELSHLNLSRLEGAEGASSAHLQGQVTNLSNFDVVHAMLEATFADAGGRPVHVATVPLALIQEKDGSTVEVNMREDPLAPNETAAFRVELRGIPKEWNNELPQVRIVAAEAP